MASCTTLHLLILILATLATKATESLPTFLPGAKANYYKSSFKQARLSKPKLPYKTHYFPQVLDHFTFQPKSSKIFY